MVKLSKITVIVLFLILLITVNVYAGGAGVQLSWDAPTTNVDGTPLTDLAGYNIYYGTESGSYAHSINVGNVLTYSFSISEDLNRTYYFAATAYDTSANESEYSNEVSKYLDGRPECLVFISIEV